MEGRKQGLQVARVEGSCVPSVSGTVGSLVELSLGRRCRCQSLAHVSTQVGRQVAPLVSAPFLVTCRAAVRHAAEWGLSREPKEGRKSC